MMIRRYQPKTIARTISQVMDRILEVTSTAQKKLDYNSTLWQELARQVKKRDAYKCVSCHGNRHLEVHHKRPVKQGGTNNPANLITLCSRCHHARHQAQLKGKIHAGTSYSPNQGAGLPYIR